MLSEKTTPSIGQRRGAAAAVMSAYAGLVLGACGDSQHESSAQIWCGAICTAVQRCGYQCEPTCVADRPKLNNISESGAAAQRSCLAQLSCMAVTDDAAWKTETDACWDQAKTTIAITAHVRDFCAGHALAWFSCGYNYPTEDCEHSYGMWTDAVINRVAACDAKLSCAELQTCQDAVFTNL